MIVAAEDEKVAHKLEMAHLLTDHVLFNDKILDAVFQGEESGAFFDWYAIYDSMLGSPLDYDVHGLLKPEAAAKRDEIVEAAKDQIVLRCWSLRMDYKAFRKKIRHSL